MDVALVTLLAAMTLSMALVPLFIRWAPALGMIDKPDPRKVHTTPIPRVGGIGIVVGALVAGLIWVPADTAIQAYWFGSLVLLVFGVWDDMKELGHYVKFVGQFIAVLAVVYGADLYVHYLPFLDAPLSEGAGKVFTVIAMVGMINAINHSDGLDGLAGGESLLSLLAIMYLASLSESWPVILIAAAAAGGVFGFLRYNSHPARVFMGDGGSQFLGFTLAFLAVYLTQVGNPALSPALPLLFLGLPIADIIAVFIQRIYHGMNWFRATKNHIHHRLLELGFQHHESVVIIYSVQALLVLSAILLPYEYDWLLLGIYFGVVALVFGALIVAERSGWRVNRAHHTFALTGRLAAGLDDPAVARNLQRLLEAGVALYVVTAVVIIRDMPADFRYALPVLAGLLALRLLLGFRLWFLFLRLLLFVAVAMFVYLVNANAEVWASGGLGMLALVYFIALAAALGVAMRFVRESRFRITPLDFLVALLVVLVGSWPELLGLDDTDIRMILQMVVLFYVVEWVLQHMKSRWNLMTASVLLGLLVLTARAWVSF
ncbi:glycosyltransferase family 4 protein [Thiohalobacter sp.]|uniref:glycosyltransferase family 4 protein n=1 Tax=Thiohalobacter sp. TaxID=2025948 RepID=UPI0026326DC2|nr:MraY family glycosyltransferase [Thiohalobacter sp.]